MVLFLCMLKMIFFLRKKSKIIFFTIFYFQQLKKYLNFHRIKIYMYFKKICIPKKHKSLLKTISFPHNLILWNMFIKNYLLR